MAETKWTPGPWNVGPHYKSDVESCFGRIAECRPMNAPVPIANAHLIASAPDLYAALEPFAAQDECGIGVLVGERDEHTAECDECQRILAARAALAKARGEA